MRKTTSPVRRIIPNPDKAGPDEALLEEEGVPVWVVVAYANSVNWNVDDVAETYGISPESVAAVRAYYDEHKGLIDCRIKVSQSAFVG